MPSAKSFRISPNTRVRLSDFDPGYSDKGEDKESAKEKLKELNERLDALQFRLYSEGTRSLLICFQAMDAGGKDGAIRSLAGAMNPQGCRVASFKQPSSEERAHDFLWRVEQQTPRRGEVAIFNRSHYEDVLVVRVHDLVPKAVWSRRYDMINDFERRHAANGTRILKFFLHISKEEQLLRFRDRLEDPARQWKISASDYSEREHWDAYQEAYGDALSKCSTDAAPWYVIPSDKKWFRNLAVTRIVVETLEDMDPKVPKPSVDIAAIAKEYHEEVAEAAAQKKRKRRK